VEVGLDNPLFFAKAVKNTTTPEEIEKALADTLPEVDVVDVELAGSAGRSTLRVFIDHPDGVDHELCVKVTGQLERYLEEHAVEVSSPGLEKRLRKPAHFRDVVGEKINVRTYGPVEGQRNFTGFLIDAQDEQVTLDMEGREVTIPLDQVARAKKLFEFPETPGKKKNKNKHRGRRRE
jgi:ribosome maturation factor RimP